jgi:CheY-like chemotaxis protein
MEEYEVAEATSGIGAVVMLGEQRFDLVIMDILLPNMRGDHVRKVAIERLGYGEVPFLFISAFLMPEGLCPYEDFFYKPLDLKRLLQRIDEILGGPYVVEGQEHGSRG